MLTKVIPVTTTWIAEENLSFDEVFHIQLGRIGFKEHSDSQYPVTDSQLREVTNSKSE
jgi:hypothetical protein